VFDEHIAHVDMRIAELQQIKAQLAALRRRCQGSASDDCGILQGLSGLSAMRTDERAARHTHLS